MTTSEEIWSTRLQREILALTEETEDEKDTRILPEFIKYHSHNLDIANGCCSVSFAITVDTMDRSPSLPVVDKGVKEKVNAALGEADTEEETGNTNEDAKSEETDSDVAQQSSDGQGESSNFKVQVLVTLDASLQKKISVFNASTSYPFFKPKAILTSGAEHFTATKVENGDEFHIDCDWTPSLHLNDAAMNIALKVRESIKRGEPCLKVVRKKSIGNVEEDLLQEVKADISKAGAKVTSFFSDLKNRASAVADEMDKAVGSGASGPDATTISTPTKPKRTPLKFVRKDKPPKPPKSPTKIVTIENIAIGDEIDLATEPWSRAVGMYPCKAIRRPAFVASAMQAAGQGSREKVRNFDNENEEKNQTTSVDDIDVFHQDCTTDNYLMLHSGGLREVASEGLSMFRSLTKSAKSVLEESFLMLTEDLVIEIKCNKFSVANAIVSFAIPVSHLAKLKFRREESLSLFFKQAPDDPIIYMCISSSDAVKQIQYVLKKHGVKGKHTNATMQKEVQSAVEMIDAIKNMEKELNDLSDPSREKVTFIMDLYRQAAEKFELAGDERHEEVMSHMRDFLAKPLVASILDGSFEKKVSVNEAQIAVSTIDKESVQDRNNFTEPSVNKPASTSAVCENQAVEDEMPDPRNDIGEEVDEEMKKAMVDAENMLKDAHKDLEDLGIDDFDDHNDVPEDTNDHNTKEAGGDDVISEFEDMLKDADKELEELMGS